MNRKLKSILIIFLILVFSLMIFGIYYVNDYHHSEINVNDYINNSSVIKTDNGLFLNGSGEDDIIIFYPGAKIDYSAYLPLLINVSSQGVDCFIVEMPFNIAFLGTDYADNIINNSSYNYTNYYLAGHSLGGVVASNYVKENKNIKGLILLASYPTDNINIPVLLIYGSMDSVLNKENYEDSKKYMTNYTEYIIDGGNHAQFAFYGNQKGDGISRINRDEQIKITADNIINFVKK